MQCFSWVVCRLFLCVRLGLIRRVSFPSQQVLICVVFGCVCVCQLFVCMRGRTLCRPLLQIFCEPFELSADNLAPRSSSSGSCCFPQQHCRVGDIVQSRRCAPSYHHDERPSLKTFTGWRMSRMCACVCVCMCVCVCAQLLFLRM